MKDPTTELTSLYWTTCGVYPGDGEISRFDFADRVAAAARAGFRGIGIWHTDLEHILTRRTLKEMKRILDDHAVYVGELEFLTHWFVTGPQRAESDRRRKLLLEASQALEAKHVKVGDFENTPCPMPRLVESFAELCREARPYGATIGFELMRSARIASLADAVALVEGAGASNGGMVLDMAHVADLGITLEEIRRVPLRYIVSVELNDGALRGSPRYDPSGGRKYCGEGELDIRGFIRCLREMGYDGLWTVEVFSREQAARSLEELNERAYRSTAAQLLTRSPG